MSTTSTDPRKVPWICYKWFAVSSAISRYFKRCSVVLPSPPPSPSPIHSPFFPPPFIFISRYKYSSGIRISQLWHRCMPSSATFSTMLLVPRSTSILRWRRTSEKIYSWRAPKSRPVWSLAPYKRGTTRRPAITSHRALAIWMPCVVTTHRFVNMHTYIYIGRNIFECQSHFQIVWSQTYLVGCGSSYCKTVAGFNSAGTIIVCDYAPG